MNMKPLLVGFSGEVVIIPLEGVGIVMAKVSGKTELSEEAVPTLNDPRLLRVEKDEAGELAIKMYRLMGHPDRLYLTSPPKYIYKVLQKEALAAYTASTSNLVSVDRGRSSRIIQ